METVNDSLLNYGKMVLTDGLQRSGSEYVVFMLCIAFVFLCILFALKEYFQYKQSKETKKSESVEKVEKEEKEDHAHKEFLSRLDKITEHVHQIRVDNGAMSANIENIRKELDRMQRDLTESKESQNEMERRITSNISQRVASLHSKIEGSLSKR